MKNIGMVAGLAAGAFLALSGLASAQNIVQNPGFDLNTPPTGAAPQDWTFTPAASGSDFFVGPLPTYGAYSAPNSANFGATDGSDDVLDQVLATTPGQWYTISLSLSHDSTNSENDFSAYFGSTRLLSLVNASAFGWTQNTFFGVATSSSTDLRFLGREVQAWYGLDNVSVTGTGTGTIPIPEASTWAMLLAGFAGLGFAGYRARRAAAAAA